MLFKILAQCHCLRKEGFVSVKDAYEGQTPLCAIDNLELTLPEPLFEDTFVVLNLKGLAVLMIRIVKEANDRSSLS